MWVRATHISALKGMERKDSPVEGGLRWDKLSNVLQFCLRHTV